MHVIDEKIEGKKRMQRARRAFRREGEERGRGEGEKKGREEVLEFYIKNWQL